jgi:hypothetical protein
MPSTFRTTTAAVLFAALLGFCSLPANAQPKGAQAGGRAETKVLEEVWHWLTDLWAPTATLEPSRKALTLIESQSTTSDFSLNRGGAYDPNGHP